MTVGLAILARDEADHLPGLLDSVRGAFDQVVLCDTGSTDGTVDCFERWARAQDWPRNDFAPWKVGHFAWCDDFAAARNHADSLLDTEWSSWADCDDEIRGAGNLRELARGAPADVGAFVAGYDYARLAGGATIDYGRRERLVRRTHARGWVHRVHEWQLYAGEAVVVAPDVCEWFHRKWTVERGEALPTPERNLRILGRWVAEEPDHLYALAFLAQELQLRGRHREAIHWFRRFLEVDEPDSWSEYRVRMLRQMSTSHLLLGERRAALRAARSASDLLPDWPESCLAMAEACLALHRWRKAERWARETLRLGPPETCLSINPLDYSYVPRLVLAGALAGMKRFDEAIAAGEAARDLVPHHPELERQLRAWRERRLAVRPRARRAPEVAAAAAMVAALLGTPTGAGAAPNGSHNELGAVTFNGIPILAPSTVGFTRRFAIGGGHQREGSQYVPFVSVFDTTQPRLLANFVVGGFGSANSDVTAIRPFDSTIFLGIDQSTTGRIGATTQFGQRDPACQTALGANRPLLIDPLTGTPFLLVGGDQISDSPQGFLDLLNASTCRVIASTHFSLIPTRPTDTGTFLFGPNGLVVAGGAGQAPNQDAAWLFAPFPTVLSAFQQGQSNLPGGVIGNPNLPGTFTGGVWVNGVGFDLVGLDRQRGLLFGACGNQTGQPDPRCGPNGARIFLDLDPSKFTISNPAIINSPRGPVVSLPFDNRQDGSSHVLFAYLDPSTLAMTSQRDVLFPSTTHIPGLGTDPATGNVLFGVTARNVADPNNSLNNNRIGVGILHPDLSLESLLVIDEPPSGTQSTAPTPDSRLIRFLEDAFVADTGTGGAHAQAAAAGQKRVVRVQIAIVRVSGHGSSLKCSWLKDRRVHFVADTPIGGSCQGARWVTASKGKRTTWTLRLKRKLPRGKYVVYSRATNAAGVTQRRFGSANRRAFSVR